MNRHIAKAPPPAEDGSPAPQFLGTRIRGLRKRRGMTLAELAEQSELTAGYISQLERNLSYPSIPALFNIARSLGVTIQWFFASEAVTAPEDEGYVVRRNSRLSVHYEDGIVDQLLTHSPAASWKCCIRASPGHLQPAKLQPRRRRSRLPAVRDLRAVGRRALLPAERRRQLQFSSQEPHRYGNPGDVDAVVIWVITPPTF
jgi:transcriptional regulator with XRE-family HTH domain